MTLQSKYIEENVLGEKVMPFFPTHDQDRKKFARLGHHIDKILLQLFFQLSIYFVLDKLW